MGGIHVVVFLFVSFLTLVNCVSLIRADGFTDTNPLRGFMGYYYEGSNTSYGYETFPNSLEYKYFAMKELMTGWNNFSFDSSLEIYLQGVSLRKNHLVFRVYVDYPSLPTGVPDFLIPGLQFNTYSGGESPDYNNLTLITAMTDLIAALGAQYDGDPRVGYVQVGFLGKWGEWHTYPESSWFPPATIQNMMLEAFNSSFRVTKCAVSQDLMGHSPISNISATNIGFHDDSFAYETIGPNSYAFYNHLVAYNFTSLFLSRSIGGEIYPDLQDNIFSSSPSASCQNYTECVEKTKASWLLNHYAFEPGYTAGDYLMALSAHRQLGYEFYADSASAALIMDGGTDLIQINLTVENVGVAPFPYALNLTIAPHDSEQILFLTSAQVLEGVESILVPSSPATFSASFQIEAGSIGNLSGSVSFDVDFVLKTRYALREVRFANAETNETSGYLEVKSVSVSPTSSASRVVFSLTALLICVLLAILRA